MPNMADLQYYLADLGARCHGAVVRRIEGTELRLRQLRAGLTTPEGILRACGLRLDALEREIRAGVLQRLDGARNRLQYLGALVEERSPMKILSRGYSLTSADGRTVLSAEQVKPGDLLTTRVADGEILSKVTGTNRRTT